MQPLGLCINKPFISILWQYWKDHVVKVVKVAEDEPNNSPSFKLSSPTRQDIVNWVHRGYVFQQASEAMIQYSFEVCNITTTNPALIWLAMMTF